MDLGGCAAEHELAPGFRVPTLAHRVIVGPAARIKDVESRAIVRDIPADRLLVETDALYGTMLATAPAATPLDASQG